MTGLPRSYARQVDEACALRTGVSDRLRRQQAEYAPRRMVTRAGGQRTYCQENSGQWL